MSDDPAGVLGREATVEEIPYCLGRKVLHRLSWARMKQTLRPQGTGYPGQSRPGEAFPLKGEAAMLRLAFLLVYLTYLAISGNLLVDPLAQPTIKAGGG